MRKLLPAFALLWTCGVTQAAFAQQAGPGFQVNRYEPTAAGEWSLLVEHPWYSSTRYFAAGITLNYAHNPLTYGLRFQDGSFQQSGAIIGNQLIGHIDIAGSFFDRAQLWGGVYSKLRSSGWRVPVAVVNVATLKAWATGKGNADKAMMLHAARREWPAVLNDDEADASWLAAMGAAKLGHEPVEMTAWRVSGLTKGDWP